MPLYVPCAFTRWAQKPLVPLYTGDRVRVELRMLNFQTHLSAKSDQMAQYHVVMQVKVIVCA